MKRLKHILIKHKRLIGVSFGTLIAILLFNAANQSYQTQRCEAVQIRFNQTEPRFITKADIHQKIDYHFTDSLVNRPYQAIPLDHLEKIINTIPHIRSTRVYTGVHGTLSIEIEQREPLLRVINRPYVDYYIDENGYRMPISNKFTPRVIVANGHFRDPNHENDTIRDPMIQQLRTIALYLHRHPYWEAQIE